MHEQSVHASLKGEQQTMSVQIHCRTRETAGTQQMQQAMLY